MSRRGLGATRSQLHPQTAGRPQQRGSRASELGRRRQGSRAALGRAVGLVSRRCLSGTTSETRCHSQALGFVSGRGMQPSRRSRFCGEHGGRTSRLAPQHRARVIIPPSAWTASLAAEQHPRRPVAKCVCVCGGGCSAHGPEDSSLRNQHTAEPLPLHSRAPSPAHPSSRAGPREPAQETRASCFSGST